MKTILTAAVVLSAFGGLSAPTVSVAGQSATHCLSVYRDGDRTYFENTCNQQITVAMCSTTRRIGGKLCGEQGSEWNPYYNQMFALDPGDKNYKWKAGNVEYAACAGFINGWSAKGKFSSDRHGNFGCHN